MEYLEIILKYKEVWILFFLFCVVLFVGIYSAITSADKYDYQDHRKADKNCTYCEGTGKVYVYNLGNFIPCYVCTGSKK